MTLDQFIKELTTVLQKANAPYAFSRNYDGLFKESKTPKISGDIDMIITPKGRDIVVDWIKNHNQLSLIFLQERSYVTNCFISGVEWGKDPVFHAIQLDLAFNLSFRGLEIINILQLLSSRRPLSRTVTYIQILDPAYEFLVTFITTVIIMGARKEKYWKDWRYTLQNNLTLAQKYIDLLTSLFGERMAQRTINCIVNAHTEQWPLLVPRLRTVILVRCGLRYPLRSLIFKLKHYILELKLLLGSQNTLNIQLPNITPSALKDLPSDLQHMAKVIYCAEKNPWLTQIKAQFLSRQTHIFIQKDAFSWPIDTHITLEDLENTDTLRKTITAFSKTRTFTKDERCEQRQND